MLTFIPKAASLIATSCVAEPSRYRPLTLSNTAHKLLAKAPNSALEAYCAEAVHPAQRGFVIGRSMALNIVEAEAAIESENLLGGRRLGIALFGVAAAFPSVGWEWIWASLGAIGVSG